MSEKNKVENATAIDPAIIKLTRDTLGQFVKRPPLADKLLNKPPFRFLHDIITAVISTTGFMKGLFLDAELDSENVKDKEAKVAFLQKAIDMVSLVTGHSVPARPNKIVAGQEPEKTNEFLQALAEAISKKVENTDYVAKVLAATALKKKLSPRASKPMSPRKESIVNEPKTEAGAVNPEAKSDKPKPQRLEGSTIKSETKSARLKPQRQEDSPIKSQTESDKPNAQKLEDSPIKSETKSEKPKPQRQEDSPIKSKAESDKPNAQRLEDSPIKSETKSDKPKLLKQDDSDIKYEIKNDKLKPSRQEGNTVKSEIKSDKPKLQRKDDSNVKYEIKNDKAQPRRQEGNTVKSETKSHKPGAQRKEDSPIKSEALSHKLRTQRQEDSPHTPGTLSHKPRAQRQGDSPHASESLSQKPRVHRQGDSPRTSENLSQKPRAHRQVDSPRTSENLSQKARVHRQGDSPRASESLSQKSRVYRQGDSPRASESLSQKSRAQRQVDSPRTSESLSQKARAHRQVDSPRASESLSQKARAHRQVDSPRTSESLGQKARAQRQGDSPRTSESLGQKAIAQRQVDSPRTSESLSQKPRARRQEGSPVKSETKSDKPRAQKQEDNLVKSDTKIDQPRPQSYKKEDKVSKSEVKADEKEVGSDKTVTITDKPEADRTEKSEGKSDKLESSREKQVMKTDKQDAKTDKQETRSDKEANSVTLKQLTKSTKGESKQEKLDSRVVKHDAIMEQPEVDLPKTQRKKPVVVVSLEFKDTESCSKVVIDSMMNMKGYGYSKTEAVSNRRDSEAGKDFQSTETNQNHEHKLIANPEPIKALSLTQAVGSGRQKTDQVNGEKQEAKTEVPSTVERVNSAVSKKEADGKDLFATGGKASDLASEKQTLGKASSFASETETGRKASSFASEKQPGVRANNLASEKQTAGKASSFASETETGRKASSFASEKHEDSKKISREIAGHPKSRLTQDEGSTTDSGQSEGINVRQEKTTDKQRLPKALRNDDLKKDASNAFTTNLSSSSLTNRFDLLTHHKELRQELHDGRDVRDDWYDSLERDVGLQDVRRPGLSLNTQRPNASGAHHLLLNPAEQNDVRSHEHSSAQEFWDSRHERKARRDKAKSEKRMDRKSEKRRTSASKQEVRPDRLGPRSDLLNEMDTIKEGRTEKGAAAAALKSYQSPPPKSEGEKTELSRKVSQKIPSLFEPAENQRFEDERQKPEINHEPDVGVILDRKDPKGDDDDDDEAEFLVRENPASVYLSRSSLDLTDESNEHGGLVKKILQTKKGLEALVLSQKSTVEIDRSEISGGDISKRRQRALLLKDVSKLRSTIQALTGNVIPLVKIMDFLQEDLDCMKKEMEQWKDEIQTNTLALQHEQRLLESAIEPLQIQLLELEKQIDEQEEMNAALKSQALQNEERIKKMISTAALLSK